MAKALLGGIGFLGALVLAGLAGRAAAAEPDRPGFDCRKATTLVERTICADPVLAKQDAAMAAFSARELPVLVGTGEAEPVRKSQRMWLQGRNQCEKQPAKVKDCLTAFYDRRLVGLAIDTLFRDPEASLAVIKEKSPGVLPQYRALYTYATTADAGMRAQKVGEILAGAFKMQDFEQKGAGYDGDFSDLKDAARDDKKFAAFLMTVSYVQARDQGIGGMPIPCAAILRRPGLIDALKSYWGSTLDYNYPVTDCSAVQPLPASVEALFAKARAAMACEGTICVSFDRDWQRKETAIRLHIADRLQPPARSDVSKECQARQRGFLRGNRASYAAARRDLANYYRSLFGRSGEQAAMEADFASNLLLQWRFPLAC